MVPFEFVEVFTEGEADIKIIYMSNSEYSSFIGKESGSFASSFPPEMDCSGIIALNDEYHTFSLQENPSNGIDLYYVALHEMGHILGLCHSANSETVMATYGEESKRNLHQYDIEGIRSIYATVKVKNEFINPDETLVSGGNINAEVNPGDYRDYDTDALQNNEKSFAFNDGSLRRFEAKEQTLQGIDRKFNPFEQNNGGWIFDDGNEEVVISTAGTFTSNVSTGTYKARYRYKTKIDLNAATEFETNNSLDEQK